MSKVLVVVGSTRKGRVSEKVAEYVEAEIAKHDGLEAQVADLKELDLPFFESELPPAHPEYTLSDERVKKWSTLVKNSDSVVLVTPEYNRALSAVQKNAIDHLYSEWDGKPVGVVAYGWSGAARATESLGHVLENLKADVKQPVAQLFLMKDIQPNGDLIDGADGPQKIAETIAALA